MAWSKCLKNCVITGPLDAFCLVCESHLKSEDDLEAHFEKPIHKKNLDSTPYFEKYKNDHIRKVKKGYYCEFCNLLLFTAAKVGLHVVETQHQNNRSSQLLRRVNNSVIAFDNISIDDRSWNGFVEDTCTICNTEFENEDIHKTGPNHTLNLIMKKIEFIDDKLVYRKIDESSYQCLTCNLVLASSTMSVHMKQADHIKKLSLGSESEIGAQNAITSSKNVEKESKPSTTSKTEVNDIKNKKHKTNLDKVETRQLQATGGPVQRPFQGYCVNPVELEKRICDALQIKDYMITHTDGTNVCILCEWYLNTETIPEHLSSRHHLTILKLHKDRLDKIVTSDKDLNPEGDKNNISDKTDNDKSKIVDSLVEFQNNDININFEMGIATCKKCSKTLNLKFNVIKSHIEEHKKTENMELKPLLGTPCPVASKNKSESTKNLYTKPVLVVRNEEDLSRPNSVSPTRYDAEIEIFAKQNNLLYRNGNTYCKLCESELPKSLKNLKEHVLGAQHRNKLTKKSDNSTVTMLKRPELVKIPTKDFVANMVNVETSLIKDVVINKKYNITMMSFLMMSSDDLLCHICDLELQRNEVVPHKMNRTHLYAMANTMVITSIENEFIRELRPDVYHCGFCATVLNNWKDLVIHLNTNSHRGNRISAGWRLRENMPQAAQRRWQSVMGFMAFMNMVAGSDSSDESDEWN